MPVFSKTFVKIVLWPRTQALFKFYADPVWGAPAFYVDPVQKRNQWLQNYIRIVLWPRAGSGQIFLSSYSPASKKLHYGAVPRYRPRCAINTILSFKELSAMKLRNSSNNSACTEKPENSLSGFIKLGVRGSTWRSSKGDLHSRIHATYLSILTRHKRTFTQSRTTFFDFFTKKMQLFT